MPTKGQVRLEKDAPPRITSNITTAAIARRATPAAIANRPTSAAAKIRRRMPSVNAKSLASRYIFKLPSYYGYSAIL